MGKSTFLNRVVGQKVTIVSDKPQTTRNKIQCVWTTYEAQIVFLDTPGSTRPYDRLGERMVEAAMEALEEVRPSSLWSTAPQVLEKATPRWRRGWPALLRRALGRQQDRSIPPKREKRSRCILGVGEFGGPYAISAATGKDRSAAVRPSSNGIPPGPKYFPDDWVVDQPEHFVVAELIREKALALTREEVPYAVAVAVERMGKREDRELIDIEATIYVERESQKGIIIGKRGSMTQRDRKPSKSGDRNLLGGPVFLNCRVKVNPDWREKESALRALGYK